MKKVLYLTNYPSPYRVSFFTKLGKICDLTVMFEESVEEQRHRDIRWFNQNYENFKPVFLSKKTVLGKKYCPDAIKWIKKDFDIILMGMYSTLTAQLSILYMNFHHIPFIIETDGGYCKSGQGFTEYWKKKLISSASMWFSPSKISDDYLAFYGANKRNIIRYPFSSLSESDILERCVDDTEKKQLKKELGIEDKFVVMTVGQFIHRKANDVLIRAASKMKNDAEILIVGGKPTQKYLDLVDELNLKNIRFIDFKPKEVLANYYKISDVFVLPTREDIWGLVINEAMAYGLPVISSEKCVAALELVEDDKNGYIIPVEDDKALAEKIDILIENGQKRKIMGQNSLSKIRKYTIESMVKIHSVAFEHFGCENRR